MKYFIFVLISFLGFIFSSMARAELLVMDVPVLVNKNHHNMAKVKIDSETDKRWVLYESLALAIQDIAQTKNLKALKQYQDQNGYIDLEKLSQFTFSIRFDEIELAIDIKLPPEMSRTKKLHLYSDSYMEGHDILPVEPFSAFINMRAGKNFFHSASVDPQAESMAVDMDGAINIRNYVLEGRVNYMENSDIPWSRQDFRLLTDDVENMVRYGIGDLSYPVTGFQPFQPMLGVSIARNFELQPYKIVEPTGRTSIFINSPSRVEVFVNGRPDRTLQLQPGNYQIADFPVIDGANDVKLRITDASGRVEERILSVFNDDRMLKKGIHEFSYNAGMMSDYNNREQNYHDEPVISAFHRYGLSDELTIGTNYQGTENHHNIGAGFVAGTAAGNVHFDLATSQAENGTNSKGRVQYRHIRPEGHAFEAALEYQQKGFRLVGQKFDNTSEYNISSRYSAFFAQDITAGISGRYNKAYSGFKDDWSYSVTAGKMLDRGLSMNLNVGQSQYNNFGFYLSFSLSLYESQNTYTTSYDSADRTARADFYHTSESLGDSLNSSASILKNDNRTMGQGRLDYYGYRFESSLNHTAARIADSGNIGSRYQQTSSVSFGTALVYSGGHAAFSRPIANSFALINRHENLENYDIGINPKQNSDESISYSAKVDSFGPAVISDLEEYYYRTVTVDSSSIPAGYDIPQVRQFVHPTYKSGTVIHVGTGRDLYVSGFLVNDKNEKLPLKSGYLEATDKKSDIYKEEVPFFTNREGKFYAYRLLAGNYKLHMSGYPSLPISVAKKKGRQVDMGTLKLHPPKVSVIRYD